jgi:NADPH-dependent 2,4-dienoyl-CoA reductase/sulfur reductase-like enzyme/nitrite reductase/ring-hydroxylating ferredoxin subunit
MDYKEAVVAKISEIPEGGMKQVALEGGEILLTRVGGKIAAVGALCTHYNARLENGILSGNTIVCSAHQACFCATSGDLMEPPALNALPKFDVEIRGNDIVVKLPEKISKMRMPDMIAPDPSRDSRTFTILGAGAAGYAAAQALRQNGFQGRIVMLSAETDLPYDRPNLNKDYLKGEAKEEWMPLRSEKFFQNRGIELLLGKTVTGVDTKSKNIVFETGENMKYDTLLLATGSLPRRLNVPGETLGNVFTLRSFAESRAIVKACENASRAVIVGASFIGLESAASLGKRGLQVTVVAPEEVPFERIFGRQIGSMLMKFHEENGVVFRLGTSAARFDGESTVKTVVLHDGTRIDADLVLIGIGVKPNTSYLTGLPLETDGGVPADSHFRVADGLYAAGDIACVPDWRTGEPIRIEHWRTAEQQGRDAALSMLGKPAVNSSIPFFWTRQGSLGLRYVGHTRGWDEILIDGDVESRSFIAFYIKNGEIRAAAGCKRDKHMAAILELMRKKRMPAAEEIRGKSVDFIKLLGAC